MTTAHRPTWRPALGMSDKTGYTPTRSYSARDLPGYLKLKQRAWGQGSVDQLKEKDFKAELLKREAQLKNKNNLSDVQTKMIQKQITEQKPDFIEPGIKKKILRPGQKQQQHQEIIIQTNQVNPFPEDEDSDSFIRQVSSQEQEDSQQQNQILLREFQKVRQQKQQQEKRKMQQKALYSTANKQTELLKGNPLIASTYSLSKRWYEDTVFKNQAKRVEQKKSYVNDNVRSDFHRKFINKYVMR